MDLLRYRKVIIYVLTFMAYAWSGYGAGLLSNLRDAVLTAETIFQDLFANAITIARKIKDIHEVFDAAVEENCIFQCPDGPYIIIHTFVVLFTRFIDRVIRLLFSTRAAIGRFRSIRFFARLHFIYPLSFFPLGISICVSFLRWKCRRR